MSSKKTSTIIKTIISVLMAVQIGIGIAWALGNLDTIPKYGDTTEYLQVADTLLIDQYRVILYPLFLHAVKFFSDWTGVSFPLCVYTLQTIISFLSWLYFLKVLYETQCNTFIGTPQTTHIKIVLLSLFMVTLPLINHYNLSVLTDSLAMSLALFFIAGLINALFTEKNNLMILMVLLLSFIASSLLRIDRLLLLSATTLCSLLLYILINRKQLKQKRNIIIRYVCMFSCILVITLPLVNYINSKTQIADYGRMKTTYRETLVGKLAWPRFAKLYPYLGEETKSMFSFEEAQKVDEHNNNVLYYFFPLIRERFGDDYNKVLDEYMNVALHTSMPEVLANTVVSCVQSGFTPVSVFLDYYQITNGATMWNYTRMAEAHPLRTKVYFVYSLYLFFALLILAVIYSLTSKRNAFVRLLRVSFPLLICSAGLAFAFAMMASAPPNCRYFLLPYSAHFLLLVFPSVLDADPKSQSTAESSVLLSSS